LRLPGLAVAAGVSLFAAFLPAAAAHAGGPPKDPLPSAFYANIANVSTDKCVNVRGDGGDGAWIQQYTCDGTGASDFHFVMHPDGTYWIVGEHSGLCITTAGDPAPAWSGTLMFQTACDSGDRNERWWVARTGLGSWQLVNATWETNTAWGCVTVPDANNWTPLRMEPCASAADQYFYLDNLLPG
jgi:hypothetical protein